MIVIFHASFAMVFTINKVGGIAINHFSATIADYILGYFNLKSIVKAFLANVFTIYGKAIIFKTASAVGANHALVFIISE